MLLARNTSRNLPQNLAPLMDEVHSAGSVSVVDEAFTPTEHDSQNIGAVDIVVSDNPSPLDVDYFFMQRIVFCSSTLLPSYNNNGGLLMERMGVLCRKGQARDAEDDKRR